MILSVDIFFLSVDKFIFSTDIFFSSIDKFIFSTDIFILSHDIFEFSNDQVLKIRESGKVIIKFLNAFFLFFENARSNSEKLYKSDESAQDNSADDAPRRTSDQ